MANISQSPDRKSMTQGSRRTGLLAWPWVWAALAVLVSATVLAWWQDPLPVPPNRAAQDWSFWKPIETNPHRRLVSVSSHLTAVTFASDGQRGWTVGNRGTILATTDGGKHWSAQQSTTTNELRALSFLVDGQRGWAVGDSGTILATVDGGQTWSPQASNTQEALWDVNFLADGQRGWAVGDSGAILATTDGGKHWSAQHSNTTNNLRALNFLANGQHGWAVGLGSLITTTDGGQNWSPQANNAPWLDAVTFLADGQHGWAVGLGGSIIITTDGGQSWSPQRSNTPELLRAVTFVADGKHGWVVGTGGTILATNDEGKNWNRQISNTQQPFNDVKFLADGQHGWAVGLGSIITTTDGGRSWSPQASSTQELLSAVTFLADGQRGWAVGDSGAILVTTDGGKHWSAQHSNTTNGLRGVNFLANGQHGWAVGDSGTILATTDVGQHWTSQASSTQQSLAGVTFLPDGQRGWTVGNSGTILATADGGQNWNPQASGTQNLLFAVTFLRDGQRGWAVGNSGTILATADGGQSWSSQTSGTQELLGAVTFLADGQRGWTVGDSGIILATVDGGQSWNPQASNTQELLNAVSFLADGQRGWVVSTGGTILVTSNGGKNWSKQHSNTQQPLTKVTFLPDGQHGWAVGFGGTILATTDGGKNWNHAEHYTRYPAPWYGLAALLAAGLMWLSWRLRPMGTPQESVADVAASDAEVRQPADDRLDFGGLARGISRFLRNTETRPPLTLAITGDWGSGKSSLMQLVCADLRRFDHRPIWFNAWHHQKEEHLFAALLGGVSTQGVPPLFTLDGSGLVFRLRLLWLRSRKNFLVMTAVVAIVTTLLLLSMKGFAGDGIKGVTASLEAARLWAAGLSFVATWTALTALYKGIRPFNVNPALLLANVHDSMSLKTAAAQNDFRAQFARQFGELVKALPYRLVIVIDDLDRCRPAAVLDLMEAVNYLTSAGECFVIFGMATERVEAALGLAFKDIAAELVQMEQDKTAAKSPANPDADPALTRRRAYAADYLQKLVNIEIKVPTQQDKAAHRLLLASGLAPRRQGLGLLADLSRLWPLAFVGVAVCAGFWFSSLITIPAKDKTSPTVSAAKVTSTVTPPVPSASDAVTAPPPIQIKDSPAGPAVQPGEKAELIDKLSWFALAVLPLLGAGALIVLRVLRKTIQETRDSPRFREALEIWTGVVASKRATPRAVKRFGNRIRYLAMLQQGEAKDETPLDLVNARLQSWMHPGREIPTVETSHPDALAEHQLIALGALHEVWEQRWKEAASGSLSTNQNQPGGETATAEDLPTSALHEAIRDHQTKFNTVWPPSEAEMAVFERLIAGVRLAGDPQTIAPEEMEKESLKKGAMRSKGLANQSAA